MYLDFTCGQRVGVSLLTEVLYARRWHTNEIEISEDVEGVVENKEQAAAQLAENRKQVGRMTRNPSVLHTSVSEDAESLWKELLIAGLAHEKAIEDWKPYCEPGADEAGLYLGAREEVDSPALGKDDPDGLTRRLHAELFLLSAEKLEEALRAFVAETSFDWGSLP